MAHCFAIRGKELLRDVIILGSFHVLIDDRPRGEIFQHRRKAFDGLSATPHLREQEGSQTSPRTPVVVVDRRVVWVSAHMRDPDRLLRAEKVAFSRDATHGVRGRALYASYLSVTLIGREDARDRGYTRPMPYPESPAASAAIEGVLLKA